MKLALLIPMSRRTSRTGLVDALLAHYGSLGRLADDRRQFEKTTRSAGEDPSIFSIALETLAAKAFGDMGQRARLRLIRDRFIADIVVANCVGTWIVYLQRLLSRICGPMPSVGKSCGPEIRRVCKPVPDPIYPTYVIGDSDKVV